MVSNALSPRRGFSSRPDECTALKNPGRCEPPPPPPPICIFTLDCSTQDPEMGTNEDMPFYATATNTCYPPRYPIVVQVTGFGVTVDPFAVQQNDYDMDTLIHSGDYFGPSFVITRVWWPNGDHIVKVEYFMITE